MKLSKLQMIALLLGCLVLGGGAALLWRVVTAPPPAVPALPPAQPPPPLRVFPAPQAPTSNGLEYHCDREKRRVYAVKMATGEIAWESYGESGWIVPGAAFMLDMSPEGDLWVLNPGRRRLEQLNPATGDYIASWEPQEPLPGCCNPVRFAALSGGRFLTMEKGRRQARLYAPSGEVLNVLVADLSASEHNYVLIHSEDRVYMSDLQPLNGRVRQWEINVHD